MSPSSIYETENTERKFVGVLATERARQGWRLVFITPTTVENSTSVLLTFERIGAFE